MDLHYLRDFSTERSERLVGRKQFDPRAAFLWKELLNSIETAADKNKITDVFEYSKNIKYDHVGLSSEVYFAHPLRVAALSALNSSLPKYEMIVIALLHNVFELTNITQKDLSKEIEPRLVDQISILTVDREQQWDAVYKAQYYSKIESASLAVRIIKVFDKLDNIFILGVNPDEHVRSNYLLEIENYILPIAKRDVPHLYPYLVDLVLETREIGFISH